MVAAVGLYLATRTYEYDYRKDDFAGRDFYSILPCEARGWPRVWHKRLTVTPEFFVTTAPEVTEEAKSAILSCPPWVNRTNFSFNLGIVALVSIVSAAVFESAMRCLRSLL